MQIDESESAESVGQSKINYAARDHEYRKKGSARARPLFLQPKKMKFFPAEDMARRLNFLFSRSWYAKVFHHFLTLTAALETRGRRMAGAHIT